MVIIRFTGGLGNQMFQYAAGRAASLRMNTDLVLNTSFFTNGQNKQSHETKLHIELFPAIKSRQLAIISTESIQKLAKVSHRPVQKAIDKIALGLGLAPSYKVVQEANLLSYQQDFHEQKARVLNLMSDWQNEKYFLPYAQTIRDDFTFPELAPSDINFSLLTSIHNSNSVSIHVRRGDYLTSELHLPTSIDYYIKAIELISSNVSNPSFFVFSDDIAWSKANLGLTQAHYISHNMGESSYIDMQLMSNCKHNIIANSSFSWWGAWLNNNKNKITISPIMWLEKLGIEAKKIIPEGWKTL